MSAPPSHSRLLPPRRRWYAILRMIKSNPLAVLIYSLAAASVVLAAFAFFPSLAGFHRSEESPRNELGFRLGLGSYCINNASCGSANCATGPVGMANDRCSPPSMVWIPSGTFTMGSPGEELGRDSDEAQHRVTISRPFFLGDREVTQGQWKALSGGINPSYFQNAKGTKDRSVNVNDDRPVEQVDWYSAVAFANAKSAAEGLTACYTLTGCTDAANGWKDGIHSGCTGAWSVGPSCRGYRLPTESEWEYAARAGTTTATYLGNLTGDVTDCTNSQGNLSPIAWFCSNATGSTQTVGKLGANDLGLHDMLGNANEWTGDWNGTYPEIVTDPTGDETGSTRVFRGGSWYHPARQARASFRFFAAPGSQANYLGFRLARTAP